MKKESESIESVGKVDIADAVKSSLLKDKWVLYSHDSRPKNYDCPSFLERIMFIFKPKWVVEIVKNKENSEISRFYLTKMLFSKCVRITIFKKDFYGNVSIKGYGKYSDEDFFDITTKSVKKLWNILTFDFKINKNSVKNREQDQSIISIVSK